MSPPIPGTYSRSRSAGLPDVSSRKTIRWDADRLDLQITPVRKRIDDAELRMLKENRSIPAAFHVDQGLGDDLQATNDGDVEVNVDWHGLRLENRSDGVPHERHH